MESFHSIKKSAKSEALSPSGLSNSYPDSSNVPLQTSMFDHTHIDPVTLKARRRRSASLGEHSFYPVGSPPLQQDAGSADDDHTPVFIANNSTEDCSKSAERSIRDTGQHLSEGGSKKSCHTFSNKAAAVMRDPSIDFVDGNAHNKDMASSRSSTGSDSEHAQLISGRTNNTAVPTVEVYPPQSSPSKKNKFIRQSKISRSYDNNNEFQDDSTLGIEGGVVLRRKSGDVVSLDDISVGFKHRSMSLESLVKAYKDNRVSLFHMEHKWEKVRDDNDVSSDDSEDDEEEAEKRESPEEDGTFLSNSMCSNLSEDPDMSCSTANSSFNGSLLHHFQDEVEIEKVDRGRHNQEQCPLLHDQCSVADEDSAKAKSTTPTPGGYSDSGVKFRAKVKRSTSQRSKGTGRRNRVKLRKPKSFVYQASASDNAEDLTSGPAKDVLVKFQTASLGCGLGVPSRQEVKSFLQETEPNSEKENHELSMVREPKSY